MKNNRSFNKKFVIPALLLASLTLFLFIGVSPTSFFKSGFLKYSAPVFEFNQNFFRFVSSFGRLFYSSKTLIEENESLKNEISRLALRSANFDLIKKENEDLRTALGLKKEFRVFNF